VTEKRGIEIENRQAQDLSLTMFMYADRNGILCPGKPPRHLLSLEPFFGPALAIFVVI